MSSKGNQFNIPGSFQNGTPQPFDPDALDREHGASNDNFEGGFQRNSIPPLPGMDIDSWADERISIFATLDAAMTSHILEAVRTLSELRRRVEEDSRRIAHQIEEERNALQREVDDLRKERMRLQDEIQQAHRDLEEEHARKLAVQKESELIISESRAERTSLSREVSNLSRQLQEMSQQMQNYFKQKLDEAWMQFSDAATGSNYVPTPSAAQPPLAEPPAETRPPEQAYAPVDPRLLAGTPVPPPSSLPPEADRMLSFSLQEFSDAPTPKLKPNGRNNSGVAKTETPPPFQPESAPPPISNLNLPEDIEAEEPDFLAIFEPASKPFPESLQRELSKKEPDEKSKQVDQHLQRLLSRRHGTQPLVPREEEEEEEETSPDEETMEAVLKEKRRRTDKDVMVDLGAKLGLDAQTPPPGNAIKFAPGFTPTPGEEGGNLAASLEDLFHTPTPEPGNGGEVAPLIGEIGPDIALQWGDSDFREKSPPPSMPPRNQINEMFPPYPIQPPPAGSMEDEEGTDEDILTKVTISNLQGLSLLMMEKVVRGLPGVRHVTVTDFRKGELVMEVRHQAALELDRVLPNLPDLNLKLVSRDDGLMFSQER